MNGRIKINLLTRLADIGEREYSRGLDWRGYETYSPKNPVINGVPYLFLVDGEEVRAASLQEIEEYKEYEKAFNIYVFACKWIKVYKEENINSIYLLDRYFGDECKKLGFEMDCGKAFSEAYGAAAMEKNGLEEVLEGINDIDLLGSALYSKWRYFCRWVGGRDDICEPKNKEWFLMALTRLAGLCQPCIVGAV